MLQALWFPNMDSRRTSLDKPVEGSCTWLFEHPTYQAWRGNAENKPSGHNLLWLRGKPGVGKSVLMKEAARSTFANRDREQIFVATFFFNARGTQLERTPTGLFRSLLCQLLPHFPEKLRKLQETFGREFIEKVPDGKILWDVFRTFLSDGNDGKILIFIDALDECEQDSIRPLAYFWYDIANAAPSNCLSVCISCRHFPSISTALALHITLEDLNHSDIKLYVDNRLNMTSIPYNDNRARLRGEILSKSAGVFLWVVLVLDDILARWDDGFGTHTLLSRLSVLPGELTMLFKRVLNLDTLEEKKLTACLFQWVLLSTQPLRLHEWHHVMAFIRQPAPRSLDKWRSSDYFTDTDEQLERLIKRISRGLVEVKRITSSEDLQDVDQVSVCAGAGSLEMEYGETRIVQVIHESVRDFFLVGEGASCLLNGLNKDEFVAQGHLSIMHTCLDYIAISELDSLCEARTLATISKKKTIEPPDAESVEIDINFSRGIPASTISKEPPSHLVSRLHVEETHVDGRVRTRVKESESLSHLMAKLHVEENRVYGRSRPQSGDNSSGIAYYRNIVSGHCVPFETPKMERRSHVRDWLGEMPASTDSPWASSDTESTPSSHVPSSASQRSQLLEDYPALLSYATVKFFAHAKLGEAIGLDATSVIRRIAQPSLWNRWLTLREGLPMSTSLLKFAELQGLQTWQDVLRRLATEPLHSSDDKLLYREESDKVYPWSAASSGYIYTCRPVVHKSRRLPYKENHALIQVSLQIVPSHALTANDQPFSQSTQDPIPVETGTPDSESSASGSPVAPTVSSKRFGRLSRVGSVASFSSASSHTSPALRDFSILLSGDTALHYCTTVDCDAGPFKHKIDLESHEETHTFERQHQCPFPGCLRGMKGKGFRSKGAMLLHRLLHDYPGYQCPFCFSGAQGKHRFARSGHLKRSECSLLYSPHLVALFLFLALRSLIC